MCDWTWTTTKSWGVLSAGSGIAVMRRPILRFFPLPVFPQDGACDQMWPVPVKPVKRTKMHQDAPRCTKDYYFTALRVPKEVSLSSFLVASLSVQRSSAVVRVRSLLESVGWRHKHRRNRHGLSWLLEESGFPKMSVLLGKNRSTMRSWGSYFQAT